MWAAEARWSKCKPRYLKDRTTLKVKECKDTVKVFLYVLAACPHTINFVLSALTLSDYAVKKS